MRSIVALAPYERSAVRLLRLRLAACFQYDYGVISVCTHERRDAWCRSIKNGKKLTWLLLSYFDSVRNLDDHRRPTDMSRCMRGRNEYIFRGAKGGGLTPVTMAWPEGR